MVLLYNIFLFKISEDYMWLWAAIQILQISITKARQIMSSRSYFFIVLSNAASTIFSSTNANLLISQLALRSVRWLLDSGAKLLSEFWKFKNNQKLQKDHWRAPGHVMVVTWPLFAFTWPTVSSRSLAAESKRDFIHQNKRIFQITFFLFSSNRFSKSTNLLTMK